MARFGLISDTHGELPSTEEIGNMELDAIIHAGDIGVDRHPEAWWNQVFVPWSYQLPCRFYGTWGNHDAVGQPGRVEQLDMPAHVRLLVDEAVEIAGVKVWFSPWSPTFGSWAWMKRDEKLAEHYAQIPDDVDVVVSHTPPQGVCDRTIDGVYAGSRSLRKWLDTTEHKRLVVCGHIHEASGSRVINMGPPLSRMVKHSVLNVSVVNERYDVVRGVSVVEF